MDNNKITHEVLYQFFILAILIKIGGSAGTAIITRRIYQFFGDKFSNWDLGNLKDSRPRWEKFLS